MIPHQKAFFADDPKGGPPLLMHPCPCAGCGARVDVEQGQLVAQGVNAPVFCLTCGYQKEFAAMPKQPKKHDPGTTNGTTPPTKRRGGRAKVAASPPKTGASKPVERRRYTERLPVRIADADVAAKSQELVHVIRERLELKERKRAVNATFREKLAYYDELEQELALSVEGKTEVRNVECIEWLLPTNEVQIVRSDTGEILKTRAAELEDLQEPLALDDPEDDVPFGADGEGAGDEARA